MKQCSVSQYREVKKMSQNQLLDEYIHDTIKKVKRTLFWFLNDNF